MNPSKFVRRSYTMALLLTGMIFFLPVYAQADKYPEKPITFVVPYPAGGVADQFARSMATELGKRLGQTVVVSNRAAPTVILGQPMLPSSLPTAIPCCSDRPARWP